jgi:uncharacterized membrane protein
MTDSRISRGGPTGTMLTAYRWLATTFALFIVVQGWLGSNGAFNGNQWMVTGHGHLANAMFLMIIVQTVLSWLLYGKLLITMREVALNAVLVTLTISQIGLGYSTRNGEIWGTMVSLHIPNGLLLMGLSTAVALLAWGVSDRRAPASE